MIWTAEAEGLLVKLWEEGKSLVQVAEAMQAAGYSKVNKNMVAGRKHMLRLRGVQISQRASLPFKRNGGGVDYLKNADGCKAILDKRGSDGLRMCCGQKRFDGEPYCPTHLYQYSPGARK